MKRQNNGLEQKRQPSLRKRRLGSEDFLSLLHGERSYRPLHWHRRGLMTEEELGNSPNTEGGTGSD